METEKRTPKAIKSTLMILIGSVLLGLVIGRSISEYKRNTNVLDEIVEIRVETEEEPSIFLDLFTIDHASLDTSEVVAQAYDFAQTQYTDDELLELYYSKVPQFIIIPSIGLESEIGYAGLRNVKVGGDIYKQWISPNNVVGWHYDSAVLGEIGNTVLNGHHNVFAEVFRDLNLVQKGDEIIIQSEEGNYNFVVASTMILPERYQSNQVRLQNAKWIQTSEDERLTLITCWPYNSNTHRLIVVAFPTGEFIPAGENSTTVGQPPLPDPLETD